MVLDKKEYQQVFHSIKGETLPHLGGKAYEEAARVAKPLGASR